MFTFCFTFVAAVSELEQHVLQSARITIPAYVKYCSELVGCRIKEKAEGIDVWPVLRLFPPCALVSHAQGSSGVVDNMPFAWRGHTKSLTTRARPSPDLAVWPE